MEETILFVTNGDGTVNCAWCDKRIIADFAVPDDNDDPICRECAEAASNDEA